MFMKRKQILVVRTKTRLNNMPEQEPMPNRSSRACFECFKQSITLQRYTQHTSKDPEMSKVWLVDMARREAELETARRSILALEEESMVCTLFKSI